MLYFKTRELINISNFGFDVLLVLNQCRNCTQSSLKNREQSLALNKILMKLQDKHQVKLHESELFKDDINHPISY